MLIDNLRADGDTVEKLERRKVLPEPSLLFTWLSMPGRSGWEAKVTDPEGDTHYLSLLDGEERWVEDGKFLENGYPVFYNGWGSRCTVLHRPAEPERPDRDPAQRSDQGGVTCH